MPFDRFVREQVAGDLLPADGRRRPPPAADRDHVPRPGQQQPRGAGQGRSSAWTWSTSRSRRSARRSWPDGRAAPAATTTSSTRSRPRDYYALAGILRNARPWRTPTSRSGSSCRCPPSPSGGGVPGARASGRRARGPGQDERRKATGPAAGPGALVAPDELPGIVVDDAQARKVGAWTALDSTRAATSATATATTSNAGKGEKTLTFQPELPEAGVYEVRLAYVAPPTGRRRCR